LKQEFVMPDQVELQRRSRRNMAWVLASVALVFFVGFVAKVVLFGR
jgi:hypothetical protein